MEKTAFFTKDKNFYRTLFSMLLMVALQNLVAYSVNMADNMMLGHYNQATLSGAATVNQIFFIVQQYAISVGNGLVVLASQYWGRGQAEPVKRITAIAVRLSLVSSMILIILCILWPAQIIGIFTTDPAIISEGMKYLSLIKWTFLLYMLSNLLLSTLRSVGTVNIAFYISVVSLIINVGINYTLIFGRFGMPEMGITGAAIGTLIARIIELLIVIFYVLFKDEKLHMTIRDMFQEDRSLRSDFYRSAVPVITAGMVWAISVPMQTAILGHLSADAIAANSVATTFYQYLKVIVVAMASVSAVMIGQSVGRGKLENVKQDARTLSVIDILIGIILAAGLYLLRYPLLSMYNLTPEARELSLQLIALMSIIMIGMSYQMPVCSGIIQGGGDTKFVMKMNMVCTWLIVMPLSFAAAFWWKLPVVLVVLAVQSDQLFKGIPVFIKFRSYNWIRKLTRN